MSILVFDFVVVYFDASKVAYNKKHCLNYPINCIRIRIKIIFYHIIIAQLVPKNCMLF